MTFESGMGSGSMGSGGMGSGGSRTITAFFDSRTDAENAIQRLSAAGISRDSVRMVEGGQGSTGGASVTHSSYGDSGSGFWDALKDLFIPDEDRYTYAEGLRRGGYLVTVTATDAQYEQALDILDDDGTVDIEERSSSWRSEGWNDYSSASASGTAGSSFGRSTGSSLGETTGASLGGSSFGDTASSTGYSSGTTTDRLGGSGEQEVIPVVEEELRVGKRDVSHGRVRVRSYVVETPVEQDVSLREERVSVERRPVDRALSGDEALFQERTIDLEERSEEAVIAKEARVREELVINKDVGTRTETVSDTVRRTEVEVDDERDTLGTRTDVNRRSDINR